MRRIAVILIVIVMLMIAALVTAFILSKPEQPETIPPDLQVIRYNIPAESNAYTYFLRATNLTSWYPSESEGWKKVYDIMEDRTNWDEQIVAALLRSNELALTEIDRGLACERCQFPQVPSSDAWPFVPFVAWRNLSYVMCLQVRWLHESGRVDEALDRAFAFLRFGQMIENGPGYLIHCSVGSAFKGMVLREIERIVTSCSLPSGHLLAHAFALSSYENHAESFRNALRGEHSTACCLIDDMASGAYKRRHGVDPWGGRNMAILVRIAYFFQPEHTKQLLAEDSRVWIRNADRSFAEISHNFPSNNDRSPAQDLLKPNVVGRLLFLNSTLSYLNLARARCRSDTVLRGCQALLALKAYKQDRGSLPETLDELVPDYLKQLPLDPFDGRPMRYSAEKKIVYSIGENLKDDGGTEADRNTGRTPQNRYAHFNGLDMVFMADF